MDALWKDLWFALRSLRKNRGFSVVAIVTFALCIGANTAIFSIILGVLLRPLPYSNPRELVQMTGANAERKLRGIQASYTKLTRVQEQTKSFEELGAFYQDTVGMVLYGLPESVSTARATGNFFKILGVNIARGRGFLPEEDQRGGAEVVVITDGFWHSHFGGRPEAIGESFVLNGRSVTIVGVLPQSFRFPFVNPEPAIWLPRIFENSNYDEVRIHSGAGYLIYVGRLRSGVTMAAAQSEINSINDTYNRDFPNFSDAGKWTLEIASLDESLVGDLRPSLLALLAAVGFVLLIGCANVASLVLTRTTARQKEIAVRRALGASQSRLVRQLLTESILLSALGGALGLAMASWGLQLLRFLPPGTLPRIQDIRVDTGVLIFTATLCMLTGVTVGLLPALQASRKDLLSTLNESTRGTTPGGEGGRARGLLVVGEVAVAVMLLTGAGLLIRSFTKLLLVNPGFQSASVMTFGLDLPQARYTQPTQQVDFFQRVVERVQELPGVETAAAISFLPLGGPIRLVYFCPEGTVCQGPGKDPIVAIRHITPDYFKTMRIPLLRGRTFAGSDSAESQRVAIINETIANRYFSGQDPIGRHLVETRVGIPLEIVGVVKDVKFNALNLPNSEEVYKPLAQNPWPSMTIVVRSSADSQTLAGELRKEVAGLDPSLPLSRLSPMEEVVSNSVAQPRLTTECAAAFAFLAVALALIGIYGVMAYTVALRVPELSLRLALGAQPAQVLRLVLSQGMRLVLTGIALGMAGAFALTRLLSSLLFDVSASDPLTFAGVVGLVAGSALLACFVPACRAMRVDPIAALRYE